MVDCALTFGGGNFRAPIWGPAVDFVGGVLALRPVAPNKFDRIFTDWGCPLFFNGGFVALGGGGRGGGTFLPFPIPPAWFTSAAPCAAISNGESSQSVVGVYRNCEPVDERCCGGAGAGRDGIVILSMRRKTKGKEILWLFFFTDKRKGLSMKSFFLQNSSKITSTFHRFNWSPGNSFQSISYKGFDLFLLLKKIFEAPKLIISRKSVFLVSTKCQRYLSCECCTKSILIRIWLIERY